MDSEQRIAELEKRIAQLEEEAEEPDGLSRRDAMKLGGAGLAGALMGGGGSMAAVDRASAGTDQSGTIGTATDPVDVVAEDIESETVTTDQGTITSLDGTSLQYESVNTGELHTNITVGEGGRYDTVSAAINDIDDASASNPYRLWLMSDVVDTSLIEWESHIDLWSTGHTLEVNADVNGAGIALPSSAVTNVKFKGVVVKRTGKAPSTWNPALATISGDETVEFDYCSFINEMTPSNSTVTDCHGVSVQNDASPVFRDCFAKGADEMGYSHGFRNRDFSAAEYYGCEGVGGDASNGEGNSHGMMFRDQCDATVRGSKARSTGVSDDDCGILVRQQATPKIVGSIAEGGFGDRSHGMEVQHSANPTVIGSALYGNRGNYSCSGLRTQDTAGGYFEDSLAEGVTYGVWTAEGSAPRLNNVRGVSDSRSQNHYAVHLADNSSPELTECSGMTIKEGYDFVYDGSASQFRPVDGAKYYISALSINVSTAGSSGATLDIGPTDGSSDIASGVPIDSTGTVSPSFNLINRGADEDIYLSVSDTSAEFTINYQIGLFSADGHALYVDTEGRARIDGGVYRGSRRGHGGYITDTAQSAERFQISGATFESENQSGFEGLAAQADDGDTDPIRNITAWGGTLNITPEA